MTRLALDRLNFLVVDDNRHTLKLVSGMLRGLGVRNIFLATDAPEAFAEMQANPIDVAIVDWEMKPMNGVEFVKTVRTAEDSPNPFLPIIMLTANTQTKHVKAARDAGAHEYLAKPVSPKGLLQRIRSIIEHVRPFVRTKTYFGPDRRRHQLPFKGPEKRKSKARATSGGAPHEAESGGAPHAPHEAKTDGRGDL